jgi:hypothetical protein
MPFNIFQWGVIYALAWVVCLADGWIFHNHVLFLVGLFFLFYSLWKMTMAVSPEDEEFERIEKAQGWRKRQIVSLKTSVESFDEWEHSHRPEQYDVERRAYLAGFEAGSRNERLKKDAND